MGKSELITSISDKCGMSKVDCERVIDAFAESVTESLINGDKVMLKGFVSFEVSDRKPRRGRNPKTGKVDTFPAAKSVSCKISQAIKDAVNER